MPAKDKAAAKLARDTFKEKQTAAGFHRIEERLPAGEIPRFRELARKARARYSREKAK